VLNFLHFFNLCHSLAYLCAIFVEKFTYLIILFIFMKTKIWQCGSPNAVDVTATLSGNILTISGEGELTSNNVRSDIETWHPFKPEIKKVIINEGITDIGSGFFGGCENLISVTIPNSVTHIGTCAFMGCKSLASITIPDSVTNIGMCAFEGCKGLGEIIIPKSITTIGVEAFGNCHNTCSVTIPSSVTNIESYTFVNCIGLLSVINLNPIPQNITKKNVFDGVPRKRVTLFVPASAVDAYRAATEWKSFGQIEGLLL
jgi:hypothetical protein